MTESSFQLIEVVSIEFYSKLTGPITGNRIFGWISGLDFLVSSGPEAVPGCSWLFPLGSILAVPGVLSLGPILEVIWPQLGSNLVPSWAKNPFKIGSRVA